MQVHVRAKSQYLTELKKRVDEPLKYVDKLLLRQVACLH